MIERKIYPPIVMTCLLVLLMAGKPVYAQDTIQTASKPTTEQKQWMPNPQRSTWLGVIFPGGGQIYNRKYWKLPIIYGGFVGCAYGLVWNNTMYRDYSQAYMDITDGDPATDSYKNFVSRDKANSIVEGKTGQDVDMFRRRKDMYRRWRDMTIFGMIAIYAVSIIDAYVDAELSDFDLSPDISMHIEPAIINNSPQMAFNSKHMPALGVQCSIKF